MEEVEWRTVLGPIFLRYQGKTIYARISRKFLKFNIRITVFKKYENILKLKTGQIGVALNPKIDVSNQWFSSVVQSCPTLCNPTDCSTPGFPDCSMPRACSNSGPSSWWCHPATLSSAIPFSSCLQSFPASGSFPRSQFFASGGQSIGASASASALPMNIQDWFPLVLTRLIKSVEEGKIV